MLAYKALEISIAMHEAQKYSIKCIFRDVPNIKV